MAGMALPQYMASPTTYGMPKPAPAPSPFARPALGGAVAKSQTGAQILSNVQAPAAPAAAAPPKKLSGGVIVGPAPQTTAPRPAAKPAAPAPTPAPQTALPAPQAPTGPDPFDEFLRNFKMPEMAAAPGQTAMPAPSADIPIAPAPDPIQMPGTVINNAAAPQAPEVGGGWADFAQRPQGPQGLGLSQRQGAGPMQTLRSMRAGGGLY